jgi:hypothetical protein
MPESSLMFFMLGGIDYFDTWINNGRHRHYTLAVIFTTLTVLTKLPAGLIGIPMIYLSLKKYGLRAFKNIELILFPFFVFMIPYLYFVVLGRIAEQKFVMGIGTSLILPNFLSAVFQKETLKYLGEQFAVKIFTIPGIVLFSFGVVLKRGKDEMFFYAWLLGAALHVVLIDAVIHLDYYLMFITPVISVFMAFACIKLLENRKYIFFLYISIFIILLNDTVMLKDAYKIQDEYITLGNYVSRCTSADDLIIIDRASPELLYTSGRKGWRLYEGLFSQDNMESFIAQGARYFIQSTDLRGSFKEYLDSNFEKIPLPGGYCIYRLYDSI